MINETRIHEEVEKTLRSMDNDGVLEENPYLFTRLKAAKAEQLRRRSNGYAFRLSLNQVLMLLVVLINIITMVYNFGWNSEENQREQIISELREDLQMDQSQNLF